MLNSKIEKLNQQIRRTIYSGEMTWSAWRTNSFNQMKELLAVPLCHQNSIHFGRENATHERHAQIR